MDPWGLVITAGSVGFILCLVPQFLRTVKTRHAEDISLGFLVLVLLSSSLTLPYMLHRGEWVFAVAQGANLAVWGTVLAFKLRPGGVPKA